MKKLFSVLGDTSAQNCHGLAQKQCALDGYRGQKDNGVMQPEKTIFELNHDVKEVNDE